MACRNHSSLPSPTSHVILISTDQWYLTHHIDIDLQSISEYYTLSSRDLQNMACTYRYVISTLSNLTISPDHNSQLQKNIFFNKISYYTFQF